MEQIPHPTHLKVQDAYRRLLCSVSLWETARKSPKFFEATEPGVQCTAMPGCGASPRRNPCQTCRTKPKIGNLAHGPWSFWP